MILNPAKAFIIQGFKKFDRISDQRLMVTADPLNSDTDGDGLPDYFDTYAQASDAAAGLVFSIWTPVDSPATIYVFDDPCGDNKGNMTIKLLDPPVGVAAARWGQVKALYR